MRNIHLILKRLTLCMVLLFGLFLTLTPLLAFTVTNNIDPQEKGFILECSICGYQPGPYASYKFKGSGDSWDWTPGKDHPCVQYGECTIECNKEGERVGEKFYGSWAVLHFTEEDVNNSYSVMLDQNKNLKILPQQERQQSSE